MHWLEWILGFWGGWLDTKISAGQSGEVFVLGQLGQLHFFFPIRPMTNLFIYYLFFLLKFWYYFIHNSIVFPKVTFCVFLDVYSVNLQCVCVFVYVCVYVYQSLICMFICVFHCALFVHAVFLSKTCFRVRICRLQFAICKALWQFANEFLHFF